MAREIPLDPALLDRFVAVELEPHPLAEQIADLVEALPEMDRAVVVCLIWGRMTKVETAAMLGVSRSYVHKIWRRAIAKLRQEDL